MRTIDLQMRLSNLNDGRTLTGIVVPYNQISTMTPYPKGERFIPGVFKRSIGRLKGGKVVKLFRNHDHSRAVGLADKLWEQDDGLYGEFRFGTTTFADEAILEVREKLLDSFSVGFRTISDRYAKDGVREVIEADILEASLAPLPSYEGAKTLQLRSANKVELPEMPTVNLEPLPHF